MTTTQTLLEIAALAAGAVGRHLAPAAVTTTRKAVGKVKPAPKPKPKPKPQPKPEYVRMYDGVTISALGRVMSSSSDLVAAYDDGLYDNVAAARKDYPNHHVVTIAIHPTDAGDFLDVEPGCCWPPADAKLWLDARRKAGAKFIGIYGDRDTWNQLQAVPGIDLRGVVKWIADQNGVAHIPPGFDGCQYDGSALDSKLHYDVSLFKTSALRNL
jgi:hypothetical protein